VTERALIAVDVAHEEWTVAARRVEALERLSERLIESEREESSRLQSNEIDDLVLARRGHGDDVETFS
jgi:flagellar biosynthesis chaperone FliJ